MVEGWLRGETPGPPLFRGVLREAWVVGKQRTGSNASGSPSALELDDSSMASSTVGPLLECLHKTTSEVLLWGEGRRWSSEAGPVRPEQWQERLAQLQGEGGEGSEGGRALGLERRSSQNLSRFGVPWRSWTCCLPGHSEWLSSGPEPERRARGWVEECQQGWVAECQRPRQCPNVVLRQSGQSDPTGQHVGRRVILGWGLCQCISLAICSILQWLGPPAIRPRFLLLHA